jgi:cytochrome c nitrite reductase small subunit
MTKKTIVGGLGAAGVVATVLVGAAGGLGLYTFGYAEGGSYLSNDAGACANCHIMQSHLDAWLTSSHSAVATCNDCHAPHDGLLPKLWVKARNGAAHSYAFTTGRFPEPLRITEANREVTERACRSCHAGMTHAIEPDPTGPDALSCLHCHADVGHPRR